MTKLKFLQEALKQKGLTIKAAKADEEAEDYSFVVEDNEGNIEVLHFYLASPFLTPMIEIYFYHSFKRRKRNQLRKRPEEFLETFDHYMLYHMPNHVIEEKEWLAEGGERRGYSPKQTKDWTLIHSNDRQRVYKLNFKVRQFKRPDEDLRTIKEVFDYNIGLPEHLEIADDTETIDKVCVSDAHDHVERLVFPIIYVTDKNTGAKRLFINFLDIDGHMTPLNGYDNAKTIHKDEVYLRHLRMLNK